MGEDTKRILKMLAEDKVSVDEAERLLQAVSGGAALPAGPEPPPATRGGVPRFLRVEVQEGNGGDRVNIRVPIRLIQSGMKLSKLLPNAAWQRIDKALGDKGIDVSKLKGDDFGDLIRALSELRVEVDGKDKVRIFCE